MANPEHLEILKQGVEAWNRWLEDNPQLPDFSGANLSGIDLSTLIFLWGTSVGLTSTLLIYLERYLKMQT